MIYLVNNLREQRQDYFGEKRKERQDAAAAKKARGSAKLPRK